MDFEQKPAGKVPKLIPAALKREKDDQYQHKIRVQGKIPDLIQVLLYTFTII